MKKDTKLKDKNNDHIINNENAENVINEDVSPEEEKKMKKKGDQNTGETENSAEETSENNQDAEGQPSEEQEEADPIQILMDQIAQIEEQKKDLEEKFIRLVAEFDNYKKRMSRDYERQSERVLEKIILSMLPIMDDLDRLLQHEEESGTVSLEGIRLIRNNFERILSGYGVKPFISVGKPFDPEKHDAMMTRESEEYEVPTVIEEFEKGYEINDKVLRHARVVVSAAE